MTTHLWLTVLLALVILPSCKKDESAQTLNDQVPSVEVKQIVTVLQSSG